jgi:copper(I)-binding protein
MKQALFAALFSLALPAIAADVIVQHAWARATVPGQAVSGAYFDITAAHDAKLLKVDSKAAGMVEVHEMKMDQGVMKMRPITELALPAGKVVNLKPNGYHVMLMDLKDQLKAGEKLPLTLTISSGGKTQQIDVQADVKSANE